MSWRYNMLEIVLSYTKDIIFGVGLGYLIHVVYKLITRTNKDINKDIVKPERKVIDGMDEINKHYALTKMEVIEENIAKIERAIHTSGFPIMKEQTINSLKYYKDWLTNNGFASEYVSKYDRNILVKKIDKLLEKTDK
jgi:hypothetical protein